MQKYRNFSPLPYWAVRPSDEIVADDNFKPVPGSAHPNSIQFEAPTFKKLDTSLIRELMYPKNLKVTVHIQPREAAATRVKVDEEVPSVDSNTQPTQIPKRLNTFFIGVPAVAMPSLILNAPRATLIDVKFSEHRVQDSRKAMEPLVYGTAQLEEFMQKITDKLTDQLPVLISGEVDKTVRIHIEKQHLHTSELLDKNHKAIEDGMKKAAEQLNTSTKAIMEKKPNGLVNVSLTGSILGFGKFTEAFSKAVDLAKGVKNALSSANNAGSNIDNVNFKTQLGRSFLGGAKGTMRIGAASLGAAMVMAVALTALGGLTDVLHNKVSSSIPSSSQVVHKMAEQAAKVKVAVGVFEVEKAGEAPQALSIEARAKELLNRNNGDYNNTMVSVNNAIGNSLLNGAPEEVLQGQKELLAKLKTMAEAQNPVASNTSAAPSHP